MFNDSQESNIILQGVLLTGIKNIAFDSSPDGNSTKLLNNQGIKRKNYGSHKTTCSFSKPYNGKDFIQSLTGVPDLSGQFIYKNNAIQFSDAAISSYGLNLDSDGFGEIKVTLQIFGDVKPTTNLQLTTAEQDFSILDQTPTISHFDLSDKKSAIKSLSYEASFNLKNSINIGSIGTSNVDFKSPTVHTISADIEMLEQEVEDVTGFADNTRLTKNIDIIFAPEADRASVDRILEIQSEVRNIEFSGTDVNDLDFSMGTCAYNAFQFSKASISNQTLNGRAGEVVQLKNQYKAYTNVKKITGSIPAPIAFPTCSEHLQKIENNLIKAKDRHSLQNIYQLTDYESPELIRFQTGVSKLDFWEWVAHPKYPLEYIATNISGEDFERDFPGAPYYSRHMYNFNNPVYNRDRFLVVDFETDAVGISSGGIYEGTLSSFELELIVDEDVYNIYNFENHVANTTTGLKEISSTDINFPMEDFELHQTGITGGMRNLGGFALAGYEGEGYEGFVTGTTDIVNITGALLELGGFIIPGYEGEGFEGFTTGATDLNLDNL